MGLLKSNGLLFEHDVTDGPGHAIELAKSGALSWSALNLLTPGQLPWVGLALLIGNRWPWFHQFRGGKGVAAFLGFTLPVISPVLLLAGTGAYVAVLKWRRTAFIASFAMLVFLLGGFALRVGSEPGGLFGILLCGLLIVSNHRVNIQAMLR